MPGRDRTRRRVLAVLVLAVAGAAGVGLATKGRRAKVARTLGVIAADSPLPALAAGLHDSDARALAVLYQRMTAKTDTKPPALADADAAQWLEALTALRAGYPKFGGYGRASALVVATRILDRFAVEPAPRGWTRALDPVKDLLASGLSDPDLDVRVTALAEVGRMWSWLPGSEMSRAEEATLDGWKDTFVAPSIRRLGDREPRSRAAAVSCLGYLPIDDAAAPAIAYLEDKSSGAVRQQVLVSFARRPALLTEDAISRHLYDPEPGVPELAELILKTRGLTQEQVGLARMINHPKPAMRASVIPLVKDRTDIDPVVWLLQLSHDPEESVRLSAVEALANRSTPEAQARIAEMARGDRSAAVRQAAGRVVTASLPPLPGSPSLNPKAN
jgi:HEAT repeat protein